MTTPAINVDSTLTTPGRWIIRAADGHVTSDTLFGDSNIRRRVESRPASVSNPANPITGWRNPSGFYHSGRELSPMPVGTLTVFFPNGITYQYTDGAGWTNQGDEPVRYDASLEDAAIGKALNKLKNSKVNLAVAFFERAETAELVVDAIHGITNLTKAFRRKDPKAFLRGRLGAGKGGNPRVTDSFLQWQYGVQPLMQDVYGTCDALREKDNERPYIITVSATARANKDLSWVKNHGVYATAAMFVNRTERHHFKVRLDYVVENPLLVALSSVGITNPAVLAWERLPFSFVADWFIPVGNWLGYLDAQLGYQFRSGTWSAIARRTETSTFGDLGGHSGIVGFSWVGSDYRYNGFDFRRGLYASVPLPSIGFKNPFPKNGVHIANAIALLAGAFR